MRSLGVVADPIRFAPMVLSCALAVAFGSFGCQSPSPVPESGAVLLRLALPAGAPIPAELRIWVYDGTGVLFANSRFPEQGTLSVPANRKELGTILIQPGMVSGALRIHVRGLSAGARVSDAVAMLAAFTHDRATVDLVLSADVPRDDDGDDVPDAIDDCPARPNPAQGGCPALDAGDASGDGSAVADGGAQDGVPQDGGAQDAGGKSDLGVGPDVASGDGAQTDVRVSDALAVDVPTADARVSDAPTADAPVSDAPTADAPVSDASISDVRADAAPSDGGGPVDVGAADVRPADVGAADVVRADATSEAGADGPRQALGTSCAGGGECTSGFCADGICCQTACDQPCQQCLVGACLPVLRQQDVPQCAGAMTCNPTGKCVSGT